MKDCPLREAAEFYKDNCPDCAGKTPSTCAFCNRFEQALAQPCPMAKVVEAASVVGKHFPSTDSMEYRIKELIEEQKRFHIKDPENGLRIQELRDIIILRATLAELEKPCETCGGNRAVWDKKSPPSNPNLIPCPDCGKK